MDKIIRRYFKYRRLSPRSKPAICWELACAVENAIGRLED